LVVDIKGGTYTEGDGEQVAEENIWTEEIKVIGVWIKLHNEEVRKL
jgi:hypothetical protein